MPKTRGPGSFKVKASVPRWEPPIPQWVKFGWGIVVRGLGLHGAPLVERIIHIVGGAVRAR